MSLRWSNLWNSSCLSSRRGALVCLATAGWLASAGGCGNQVPKDTGNSGSSTPAMSHHHGGPPSATGTADGGLKRIIVLTNGNSPFWDACGAGVKDADSQLKLKEMGFSASLEVNDGTPQGQIDKLRQYGNQSDIAAVGVSAIDADNVAVADELRKLSAKGIKVVTIDSDLNRTTLRDARFAFVGTDNLKGGKALGQCAKALRPEGGDYVTFVGRTGAQNAIERIGGFGEGAGDTFKSVDSMGDDLDRTRARDNVRNSLRNHPGITCLVGIWSYNAPAIVDVVRELNSRDKVKIVTFDAEPIAIQNMAEGAIDAMVVQDPYQMGFQGVKLLAALVKDDKAVISEMFPKLGEPDGDIYDTGLKVVAPNAESPIKADLFDSKVKFMLLGEFQDWLKQYGLAGS